MELTREEVMYLDAGLTELGRSWAPRDFAKAAHKTKRALAKVVREFHQHGTQDEAYTRYHIAKMNLAKRHAETDDTGAPVKIKAADDREAYKIADQAAFDAELAALSALPEHVAAIEAENQRRGAFVPYMAETVEVTVRRVKFCLFPDQMTAGIYDMIWPMDADYEEDAETSTPKKVGKLQSVR